MSERKAAVSDRAVPNVGILIFEGAELLDFTGPFEAFSTAGRYETPYFNTFTVAATDAPITTPNGLRVLPDHSFDSVPPIDILVVPGGQGTRREVDNPAVIDWIKRVAVSADLVTSVCTGSFLLAQAGLLDGLQATTHWRSIDRMRETYPSIDVLAQSRFVDQGKIVTSAGVSAGIDMALHVIERVSGRDAAESSARLMEYDYWTATAAD